MRVDEVEAYLAAVDAFRAEGLVVEWRPERPRKHIKRRRYSTGL